MAGLTAKQRSFVDEYIVDKNATQAAIRAGYSPRTANEQSARLLAKVSISAAIDKELQELAERAKISADKVLKQYVRMAFFDIRLLYGEDGRLLSVKEWPDEAIAAIAGFETIELTGDLEGMVKKVKLVDKRAALADIGKHLGMFDSKEKTPTDPAKPGILKTLSAIMGKG